MIKPELKDRHVTNSNVSLFESSLKRRLDTLLPTITHGRTITVDLSGFDTINDTGLATLIRIRNQVRENNKTTDIRFTGLGTNVRTKIETMGLNQAFGLEENS